MNFCCSALRWVARHQACHWLIVNTHAIEPQVNTLEFCALIYLFNAVLSYMCLKFLQHLFQALVEFFGTLSKEWALECMKDLLLVNLRGNLQIIVQVRKKKTDCLCCYSGTWPLLFRELIKLKIYLLLGCKRILWAIGSGSMYETLWAVQVIWRPLLLPWFLSELKVSFLCYLMICLLFSSHGICIFYYKSNCIINIPKKQGHNFISLIMGYVELKEDLR